MADLKISQLTGATTPLTGTEELPIVQSGSTKKVSVDNLTAGKPVSASSVTATNFKTSPTAANLDISATTIAAGGTDVDINITITPKGTGRTTVTQLTTTSPRVLTSINDTNGNELFGVTATGSAVNKFTVANAATGNNPVISATGSDTNIGITLTPKGTGNTVLTSGNLVVANGNGIDFSATPGTGTSELLNDYEEGTWTPTVYGQGTAGTYTLSGLESWYTKVGNLVTCFAVFGFSAASGGAGGLRIAGLPFSYGKPLVGLVATGTVNFATASPLTISIISAATPPSTICYIVSSIDNAELEELDIGSVSVSSDFRLCFSYVV